MSPQSVQSVEVRQRGCRHGEQSGAPQRCPSSAPGASSAGHPSGGRRRARGQQRCPTLQPRRSSPTAYRWPPMQQWMADRESQAAARWRQAPRLRQPTLSTPLTFSATTSWRARSRPWAHPLSTTPPGECRYCATSAAAVGLPSLPLLPAVSTQHNTGALPPWSPPPCSPLFVSWHKRSSRAGPEGRLRGCIGTLEPRPLHAAVRDYALTRCRWACGQPTARVHLGCFPHPDLRIRSCIPALHYRPIVHPPTHPPC